MMWEALGGLTLFGGALVTSHWAAYRTGRIDGRDGLKTEMAELRAQRRADSRARAAMRGHTLAAFPDEAEFERLASTGELAAMAEAGETGRIKDEVAEFFRVLSLRERARKRAAA